MSSNVFYSNVSTTAIEALELLERDDLLKMLKTMINGGVSVNFHGKRLAQEIYKKVRPRVTRIIRSLCVGTVEEQAENLLIEGENLQAMVTLYKYRGQVDLILTDPPYNTGNDFRYNDKWDNDPNDPELGNLVKIEDGSRHTKWMKTMLPRLNMMKEMLKPNGVLAICIDENELYKLGMMMDEVFGEENRLGIVNWQKTYSPKNQEQHLSTATEYVLVYAKDKFLVNTSRLSRTAEMDERYWNPDNDSEGKWKKQGDPSAKDPQKGAVYGIQSPFTGQLYYPPEGRHWGHSKTQMKKWLQEWGLTYQEKDIKDNKVKALLIKDIILPLTAEANKVIIAEASKHANERLTLGNWPRLHFGANGTTAPNLKRYLMAVQRGKVPLTYWADEDYDEPMVLGAQSWNYEESGHSQAGINELDAILGKGHGFQTVKPLKLIKKIIQLWCPPNGLVLDPFAGSGTTGHGVLELNHETVSTHRRFILIEQGRPENGDKYARSLTRERIARAITGERPDKNGNLIVTAEPFGGGFEFRILLNQIDAKTVLTMKKDELIDVVVTSHWENDKRSGINLIRIEQPGFKYLVGKNEFNEGYFIIWDGDGPVGQLDIKTYGTIIQEANRAGLKHPFHVYARYEVYQSKTVNFYKIPDKILAHLGLNENSDRYNEEEVSD